MVSRDVNRPLYIPGIDEEAFYLIWFHSGCYKSLKEIHKVK